jgi:hypothetical protein
MAAISAHPNAGAAHGRDRLYRKRPHNSQRPAGGIAAMGRSYRSSVSPGCGRCTSAPQRSAR